MNCPFCKQELQNYHINNSVHSFRCQFREGKIGCYCKIKTKNGRVIYYAFRYGTYLLTNNINENICFCSNTEIEYNPQNKKAFLIWKEQIFEGPAWSFDIYDDVDRDNIIRRLKTYITFI